MFRPIRLLLSLATLAALVYFSVTVPLGERTLWEHLRAIATTDESQKLVDGIKHTAHEVAGKVTGTDASGGRPSVKGPEKQPSDPLTPEERARLRELIRDRMKEGAQR